MKTLCVMDSVSRANGGIFEAERRLQQTLHAARGIDVRVVGLRDSHADADLAAWAPLVPALCTVKGPTSFGYAPALVDTLFQPEADLASFVGLWKYPSVAALRWASRTHKPFLVSPHGMLDAWALRNSRTKKRLAAWFFQDAQLKKATCLRALGPAEAASIRAYGLKNPICIIPNGIDLPEHDRLSLLPSPFPSGRKVLLYLGRLHPKKGLGPLLAAWQLARANGGGDWLLAIAGWDQAGHAAELKQQATALGLPWKNENDPDLEKASILFLGPKFGEAKARLYAHCDAFILPSLSEGLPMVILEAWAYGKPVVMTPECNLLEGFSANAALRIAPTIDSAAEGLTHLFAMTDADRQAMGRNGLALVRDRFTWSKVADDMMTVYQWMLGGGLLPSCMEAP